MVASVSDNRFPAREQSLPQAEVSLLRSLSKKTERNQRALELYTAGWTLQAIGDAFEPTMRRSTVKYWVDTADAQFSLRLAIPVPNGEAPKGRYIRKRPKSPGISAFHAERLAHLAPIARQYRSGMGLASYQGQANQEFNTLLHTLYEQYITIAELARASGVTFRAIARRLGR